MESAYARDEPTRLKKLDTLRRSVGEDLEVGISASTTGISSESVNLTLELERGIITFSPG